MGEQCSDTFWLSVAPSVQLKWFGETQLIVLYKGQAFKVLPPDTLEHRQYF